VANDPERPFFDLSRRRIAAFIEIDAGEGGTILNCAEREANPLFMGNGGVVSLVEGCPVARLAAIDVPGRLGCGMGCLLPIAVYTPEKPSRVGLE
jgi:hypothetical protein